MNICLIRHADAGQRRQEGADDAERPLTEQGREQCRILARALARRGVVLGKVAVSPLIRAHQTAEELLSHWPGPRPELHVCQALKPDGKLRKLTRFVRALESNTVTVVGHMPDLAQYAGWLLGYRKLPLALAKGGAAWIECDPGPSKGRGALIWMVTPEWCEEEVPADKGAR
jgi:phosphohistidine phosphatase